MDHSENSLEKYFPMTIKHQLSTFKKFKYGAIMLTTALLGGVCYKL